MTWKQDLPWDWTTEHGPRPGGAAGDLGLSQEFVPHRVLDNLTKILATCEA